jgi:hypothetical protein
LQITQAWLRSAPPKNLLQLIDNQNFAANVKLRLKARHQFKTKPGNFAASLCADQRKYLLLNSQYSPVLHSYKPVFVDAFLAF